MDILDMEISIPLSGLTEIGLVAELLCTLVSYNVVSYGSTGLEVIVLSLSKYNYKLCLCVFYRPPSSPPAIFDNLWHFSFYWAIKLCTAWWLQFWFFSQLLSLPLWSHDQFFTFSSCWLIFLQMGNPISLIWVFYLICILFLTALPFPSYPTLTTLDWW